VATHMADRDGTDLLLDQLASIQAWLHLRHHDQLTLVRQGGASREQHVDLRRRGDAFELEAAALREHASRGEQQPRPARVVLIHRNGWLLGKLHDGLTGDGAQVVATATDGAAGCGIAIAEAPELLFLEAGLPNMTGADVTRRVLRCSPRTRVVGQVPHTDDGQALLSAGATATWPRQVPHADLVEHLRDLLLQPSA